MGLGIVLFIVGGILCAYGVSGNNDMDKVMESFFGSGVTNPGDIFIVIGIFVAIFGVILIVLGYIKSQNSGDNKKPGSFYGSDKYLNSTWLCECGVRNWNSRTSCVGCGRSLKKHVDDSWVCTCGTRNDNSIESCKKCGRNKEII